MNSEPKGGKIMQKNSAAERKRKSRRCNEIHDQCRQGTGGFCFQVLPEVKHSIIWGRAETGWAVANSVTKKQAAGEEGLLPRETAAPGKINSLARAGHGGPCL